MKILYRRFTAGFRFEEEKRRFRTFRRIFPRTISREYVDRRGGDSIIRYKCASSMYEKDISRAMGEGLEIYRANTLLLLCLPAQMFYRALFIGPHQIGRIYPA